SSGTRLYAPADEDNHNPAIKYTFTGKTRDENYKEVKHILESRFNFKDIQGELKLHRKKYTRWCDIRSSAIRDIYIMNYVIEQGLNDKQLIHLYKNIKMALFFDCAKIVFEEGRIKS